MKWLDQHLGLALLWRAVMYRFTVASRPLQRSGQRAFWFRCPGLSWYVL